MLLSNSDIFIIHQFIISILCLFLIFYAWRDQHNQSYNSLKKISKMVILSMLVGICIGLFGVFLNEWGNAGIILSLSFAILITLSIYDPKYACAFFVFLLISRPWEFITNDLIASMPRDISIITIVSLIAHKILRKEFYIKWNLAHFFVLSYSVWTFFSAILSDESNRVLIIYSDVFIKSIIIYFIVVNVVKNKSDVTPIQAAFMLGLLEKTLICFNTTVFFGREATTMRLESIGIAGNSNDVAAIMILAIPFTVAIFSRIKSNILRYLLNFLVILFHIVLIWKTKSRGAVLGLGAYFIAWFWINAKNKKLASILVLAGFIGVIGVMKTIQRESDDTESSTGNRILFWKSGINMAVRNPLFGVGYDGYRSHMYYYAQGNVGTEGGNRTVHSIWILALAETGFIGFFLYIGTWIYALYSAFLMRYDYPEYILGILAYGTVASFLSHTYLIYPYLLLALTISRGQFYRNSEIRKIS